MRRASGVGRRVWALFAAALAGAPLGAQPAARAPELLSASRIDSLGGPARDAWHRYVARSRALEVADRAFMAAELTAAGLARMRRATYARGFAFDDMTPAAAASDSARRLAASLLTWQTPAGGWSKRTDMTRPREAGESWYAESDGWHYIGTIDNGSTTSQLRFLARVADATGEARFATAYLRGLAYLLDAQMPNGCWPQVFPLQGGYGDAVTFNDDAAVDVLVVLREAEAGTPAAVPAPLRARAADARRRGHDCLLAAQVRVNGVRTVWGQQHDPLTLAVTKARSYELAGLSGRESAGILTYLMTLPDPDARVVAAVDAAAAYFERTKIFGYEYGFETGLRERPGAGPIWARLREIGSDRPIFANRDGVTLYDWNQLTDRRTGYAWYGTEPGSALAKYAKWQRARAKTLRVRKDETTGDGP